MQVQLPEILNIPPKLLPMVTDFNEYRYFHIEGGRGSGKSHSVARFLLYLAEQTHVRIVCGREIQNSIEESVYTILVDLIKQYNLAFTFNQKKIEHMVTGSTFKFKGFREQGAVNVKGLEGVDILWIDEAQAVTKLTMDTIIPTIRKDNAKLFFTMNPFMRDDAVSEFARNRKDCLSIKINYYDNPHCPLSLKVEAEESKARSERDYAHIWLGEPLATAGDYIFNYDKLWATLDIQPAGEALYKQRILGIDFAAQGDDMCVATILDRVTNQHWELTERICWDDDDAMSSVGRIVTLIGQHKPDVTILDVGGMGHVVHSRLIELGQKIERFDGASTVGVAKEYRNARAEGYFTLKDWIDNGFLKIHPKDKEVIKQLEKIKQKYRSDGKRILEAKVDMKGELGYSPDDADSLMMAVYGAVKHLGRGSNSVAGGHGEVRRISGSRRKR